MSKIEASLTRPYDIIITEDFRQLECCIKQIGDPSQVAIITDNHVAQHYLKEIEAIITGKVPVITCIFPEGEASKRLETICKIYDQLIENQFDRSGLIIALGGGVVGDMAGFIASTYMRGVPFIQIPTTIVSQNDSSIGGKVGIDYHRHKNMIGTFYQPQLVYINVSTLKSLPQRELIGGLSEVIKHGLIKDANLFDYLIQNKDKILEKDEAIIQSMTQQSCQVKINVVEEDPTEKGIRKILNFGHTIGHAVETLSGFKMSHGECVGYGMAMASWISAQRGYIHEESLKKILELLKAYGLMNKKESFDEEAIYNQIFYDKKKTHGKVPFILLKNIGEAIIVQDITKEEIISSIRWIEQKCL